MSNDIITATTHYVRETLADQEAAHDWHHIYRVWQLAKTIGKAEKADLLTVELAALLHDIGDYKFHNNDDLVGPKLARAWLQKNHIDPDTIDHVTTIIKNLSFSKSIDGANVTTIEGKAVQDADQLDAIGAIGIARCFSFGGHYHRPLYDPTAELGIKASTAEYRDRKNRSSIEHFYEKLLLLKDRMNTDTGKHIALQRHKFMEQYLEQFFNEWEGKQ